MKFSFELLRIACNRVLSSKDSDWGAADGIRVYFIAVTTGGDHRILVSGREFPPPDICDNYSFVPGKKLDLNQFPPHNAADWELGPVDLSDTDSVAIAILGVNEGLPWIGGGGGFGAASKANLKSFEEFAKEAADEALHVAGGAAFASAWTLLEGIIESINHAPDCRGIAFCYQVELSMKKLLHDHLISKSTTHRLGSQTAVTALGLVAKSKQSADCGSPQYDVDFRIIRNDGLHLLVDDVAGVPRKGERTPFEPQVEECRPVLGMPMFTWPVFVDRTITVTPSHYYPSLKPTWYVNGIELQRDSDTLDLSKPGDAYIGDDILGRPVSLPYERLTSQGIERLVLHTKGEDGNYRLEVELRFNFEGVHPLPPDDPWADFKSTIIWVTGTSLEGNAAWEKYMICVIKRQVARLMVNYLPVDWSPERPGPVEIATLERHARQLVLPSILDAHGLRIERPLSQKG